MIVTFEGYVYQGDEAIVTRPGADGTERRWRTAVVTTNDENPSHISFYSRDEAIDLYPLKVGQQVRVTVEERDSKNDRGYWQTSRKVMKVEYL